VGRSSNCPLCEANFYCRTSTLKDVCPLHTTSSAGSYSRVNCICDPGYQCTYYKQIQAIVTLNATMWEFQNNVNGVRTAFIAAMAAAAGVQPSQVTINDVLAQTGRRLLALSSGDQRGMIDVHASVHGAVVLNDLDKHLNRHIENLHISHSWKQAPQVRAVALARSPERAEIRKAEVNKAPERAEVRKLVDPKPERAEVRKLVDPKPAAEPRMDAALKAKEFRDKAQARLVQLVDKEKVMGSLFNF
jgi:hypothetical protein